MAQARHKQGSIRHNAQQTGADSIHYDGEKKSLKKFAKGVDNRQEKSYTILVPREPGERPHPTAGRIARPYYTYLGGKENERGR